MSKQRLRQALVAALLLLAAWLVALLAVTAFAATAFAVTALADATGAWPADEASGAAAPAYAETDTDSNADDFGAAPAHDAAASSATPAAPRAQRAGEFRFPARARSPCSWSAQTSAGAHGSEAEHAV